MPPVHDPHIVSLALAMVLAVVPFLGTPVGSCTEVHLTGAGHRQHPRPRRPQVNWETTLSIGDIEFRSTKDGPFPNHQLRISVRPSAGLASINYMDHDDSVMPIANSFNPKRPLPDVDLIFNGSTGAIFPRTAAISISSARDALMEWLETRKRPTNIQWRPYDSY
jgi:Immunity protein Imm1